MSADALRHALGETFAFYFKAHVFHWNVVGPTFPELHALFGSLYEDAHGAVDDLAERLRTLGEFAPNGFYEMLETATIADSGGNLSAPAMVRELHSANESVISALYSANDEATKQGNQGLANFLQERMDKHAKHGWMLAATAGGQSQSAGAPRLQSVG